MVGFVALSTALSLAVTFALSVLPTGGAIIMTNGTKVPVSGIEGTWSVTGIRDATIPSEAQIEMTFGDGRVSGIAGCSGFKATAVTEGNVLRLGMIDFGSTECAPEIMQAASDFIRALGSSGRFEVTDGEQLTLYAANIPLVFAERKAPGP